MLFKPSPDLTTGYPFDVLAVLRNGFVVFSRLKWMALARLQTLCILVAMFAQYYCHVTKKLSPTVILTHHLQHCYNLMVILRNTLAEKSRTVKLYFIILRVTCLGSKSESKAF